MTKVEQSSRPLGGREGVGIIEVVVALLCLGIAIAGMCSLTMTSKESGDLARDHYVAINLAKNRLERSKSFGFNQLSFFAENDVIIDQNGNPDLNGHYKRTTIVTNIAPSLYEVEVNVEIRNRVSLEFYPGAEGVKTLVTDIQ